METWVAFLIYLAGVVVSIFVPWIVGGGGEFDWRMNIGRVVAAVVGALILATTPLWDSIIADVNGFSEVWRGAVFVFVAGLGASQAGRMIQKGKG